jgi:hypothetical protein
MTAPVIGTTTRDGGAGDRGNDVLASAVRLLDGFRRKAKHRDRHGDAVHVDPLIGAQHVGDFLDLIGYLELCVWQASSSQGGEGVPSIGDVAARRGAEEVRGTHPEQPTALRRLSGGQAGVQ